MGGIRYKAAASFADDHLYEEVIMMSAIEIERLRNALKRRGEVLARKEAAVERREDRQREGGAGREAGGRDE